jgi:hypothetical protein
MKPTKGKLFVLLALIGAIGLVTATGAFGSVTAQRTADVSVAGDDAALLGLEAGSAPGASTFITGTDEITIDLSNVNTNATTEVPNSLNITNRGDAEVAVSISTSGSNTAAIAFGVQSGELAGTDPSADLTWPETGNVFRIDSGTSIDLESGESVQVGFYIDTSDSDVTNGLTTGSAGVIGADTEIITSVEISASQSSADGEDNSNTANLDAA